MYKKSIIGHLVRFVVALAVAVSASGAQVGAALAQPNAATSSCIRPTVVNVDSAAWEKYLKCLDDHNLPIPVRSHASNSWCNPPSVDWMKVSEANRTSAAWWQFLDCLYGSPLDQDAPPYTKFMQGESDSDKTRPIVLLIKGIGSYQTVGNHIYCEMTDIDFDRELGDIGQVNKNTRGDSVLRKVAEDLVSTGYECGKDIISFSYQALPSLVAHRDGRAYYAFPSYGCQHTFQRIERTVDVLEQYIRVVKEKWPGRKVQLIGHELGGLVAMELVWRSADDPANHGWVNEYIQGVITFDSPFMGISQPVSKAIGKVYKTEKNIENGSIFIDSLLSYLLGIPFPASLFFTPTEELFELFDSDIPTGEDCKALSYIGGQAVKYDEFSRPNGELDLKFERTLGLNWAGWYVRKLSEDTSRLGSYRSFIANRLPKSLQIINVANEQAITQAMQKNPILQKTLFYPSRVPVADPSFVNGLLFCSPSNPCHVWRLGINKRQDSETSFGMRLSAVICHPRREALVASHLLPKEMRDGCGSMQSHVMYDITKSPLWFAITGVPAVIPRLEPDSFRVVLPPQTNSSAGGRPGGPMSPPKKQQ